MNSSVFDGRAVVDGDRHAVACDVACQVRAHDGEPGDPDLAHRQGPYKVMEPRAVVSGRPAW